MSAHRIFKEILGSMGNQMAYLNDAPCRVTAETQKYLREQEERERFPVEFNEYDDAIMHDVIGNERLRKPIQSLLETLAAYDATQGSFGADVHKSLERLLVELRALRQACVEEWNDL